MLGDFAFPALGENVDKYLDLAWELKKLLNMKVVSWFGFFV